MASDTADTFSADPQTPPEKNKGGCLKGCLIALVVILILGAVAAFLVARNIKGLVASAGAQTVKTLLAESGLPAEEQAEVMVEVNRVADAFKTGDLSLEESGSLLQELIESPVMNTFLVLAIERGYVDNSGLSDEEKADATTTLTRYTRGVADGSIDTSANDELMQHVADKDEQGNWQLRQKASDEDLRALLAAAKQNADEAGVPAEVEPIDPSDEIKKIVDKALAPDEAL